MGLYCSLILTLGVFLGFILGTEKQKINENKKKVTGVVQIDHETGLCRFFITDATLSDPKCEKIIFLVEHDAKITEQDMIDSHQKQGI
jgi:hypothetical protein